MKETTEVNYGRIDSHLHPRVQAAVEHGFACEPTGQRLSCPCGYTGEPEVIIAYSQWDEAPDEYDMYICPNCGDA